MKKSVSVIGYLISFKTQALLAYLNLIKVQYELHPIVDKTSDSQKPLSFLHKFYSSPSIIYDGIKYINPFVFIQSIEQSIACKSGLNPPAGFQKRLSTLKILTNLSFESLSFLLKDTRSDTKFLEDGNLTIENRLSFKDLIKTYIKTLENSLIPSGFIENSPSFTYVDLLVYFNLNLLLHLKVEISKETRTASWYKKLSENKDLIYVRESSNKIFDLKLQNCDKDASHLVQNIKSNKSNFYGLIIENFFALPGNDQELIFQKFYNVYTGGLKGLNYEQFKLHAIERKGLFKAILLIYEKTFNSIIGIYFSAVDEVYLKENDCSIENLYYVAYDIIAIAAHYIGNKIGQTIVQTVKYYYNRKFGGRNFINYRRFFSPFSYDMVMRNNNYTYPTPGGHHRKWSEELLQKLKNLYNFKQSSSVHRDLIHANVTLAGDEFELARKLYDNGEASKYIRYFVEVTGLQEGAAIVNYIADNLIEGNTLEVEGKSSVVNEPGIEFTIYDPAKRNVYKI